MIAAKPMPLRFDAMPSPADRILTNAKIITVDADFRIAEAMAIAGDRIVAVGSAAEVARHAAPATDVIDLAGQTVMPGLIDGHAHMDREGLKSVFPTLGRVRSIKDIQDRIAELARDHKPGEWIVTMPIGDPPYYFDMPELLAEKRWPTRQELDEAAPHNPVFIRSIWGFWRHTLAARLLRQYARRSSGPASRAIRSRRSTRWRSRRTPAAIRPASSIEHEMQPIAELIWFRQAPGFTRADRARTLAGVGAGLSCVSARPASSRSTAPPPNCCAPTRMPVGAGTLSMRAALAFSPNWKAAGNVSSPHSSKPGPDGSASRRWATTISR